MVEALTMTQRKIKATPMKEKRRGHEELTDNMDIGLKNKWKVSGESNIEVELQGHNEGCGMEQQGMGNRPTVRGILELQKEDPNIFFLVRN
jgi:hypothetical protein